MKFSAAGKCTQREVCVCVPTEVIERTQIYIFNVLYVFRVLKSERRPIVGRQKAYMLGVSI